MDSALSTRKFTNRSLLLSTLLIVGCNNEPNDLSMSIGNTGRDETSIVFAQIDELKQDRAREEEIRARMRPSVTITAPDATEPVEIAVAEGEGSMSNFTADYSNESIDGRHTVKVNWTIDEQSIAEVTYFLNFDNGVWSADNEDEDALCEDGSSCAVAALDDDNKPKFPDTDGDLLVNLSELNIGTEWVGESALNSPVPGGLMQEQIPAADVESFNLVVLEESLQEGDNFADWGTLGKLIVRADDQDNTEIASWRANYAAGQIFLCMSVVDSQEHQAQVTMGGNTITSAIVGESPCSADEVAYASNIADFSLAMFESLALDVKITNRADEAEIGAENYALLFLPLDSINPSQVSDPLSAADALRDTGQHNAFINLVESAFGSLAVLDASDKIWTWFAPIDSVISTAMVDDHRTFVDRHIYFAGRLNSDELGLLNQISTNNQNVSSSIVTSMVDTSNGEILIGGHRVTSIFSDGSGSSVFSIDGILGESVPEPVIGQGILLEGN